MVTSQHDPGVLASDTRRREPVSSLAAAGTVPDEVGWLASSGSTAYFLNHYCQVYDPTSPPGALGGGWRPFRLWPSQVRAVETLAANRLCVVLKARQLGMSWLSVAYALWLMLFRCAATVLLFSKRDDEAVNLLNFRLRGMYDRLPPAYRAAAVLRDNVHEVRLSNGSNALAFPTTGGRSYTASLAIVDEADHVGGAAGDDLDALLNAVKPTIDGGGRLVLLSTVDKTRPESAFKRIYKAAQPAPGRRNAVTGAARNDDITGTPSPSLNSASAAAEAAGADAAPPGKRARGAKAAAVARPRDPKLDHPAVVLYKQIAHLTPGDVQRDAIVERVTDIEAWGACVRTWMLRGNNKMNVGGMLDWYRDGIPQHTRGGNGHEVAKGSDGGCVGRERSGKRSQEEVDNSLAVARI